MSAQVYTDLLPRRHPLSNNNLNNIPYRQPPVDNPAALNLKHRPSAAALKHPSLKPFPVVSKQTANVNVPPAVKHQPASAHPNPNPPSPPLPRQNAKVAPPSPPRVIIDLNRQFEFARLGLLGEGGFARVYEVQDRRGQRCACKVVTRASLRTKKAKTKLYAEIRIHKSLHHPNIVAFQDCFEDTSNVYMTLELCPNGSLMDLLRRRRRLSEPESRFFLLQLLGACAHMHACQVIHRDLKLGNIFLDTNMNVKVGDFGLAALIERPGERKKTICGTPNYIAPEVLFDTANGHSFEVDTWSIGVILYTLVIGRPPFQTKDVKEIYNRIRDNDYDFPSDPSRAVSAEVRVLVQVILTPDPQARPALRAIARDAWFSSGPVPARVPASARDSEPNFSWLTRAQNEANLRVLRKRAALDGEGDNERDVENDIPGLVAGSGASEREREKENVTKSLAQQEREFQRAVQPGSPISDLLNTAKQPLIVASRMSERERDRASERGEVPLFRKLQAAKLQAERERVKEEEERDEREREREDQRRKELESQKARIVAQMVPRPEEDGNERYGDREEDDDEDRENIPPRERVREKGKERERVQPNQHQRKPSSSSSGGNAGTPASAQADPTTSTARSSGFEAAAQTLAAAFEARDKGRVFRDGGRPLPDARVFIVSWVDYCNKYGMGYALTDGSVGVHFNDSTSVVLSPDKIHFDYISSRRQGSVYVRKSCTVSSYPDELKSKVYLVKHFERYIMDRLYGEYEYTFVDGERTKGMDFVQKYLRMKHVIVFKMSSDVIQFNFYDHSKIILSSHGLLVTHIDRNYALTRYTLSELMAASLRPPPSASASAAELEQAKTTQRLMDKVRYCRDVLATIVNAAQGVGPAAGEGEEEERLDENAGANVQTLASRASKMSLR